MGCLDPSDLDHVGSAAHLGTSRRCDDDVLRAKMAALLAVTHCEFDAFVVIARTGRYDRRDTPIQRKSALYGLGTRHGENLAMGPKLGNASGCETCIRERNDGRGINVFRHGDGRLGDRLHHDVGGVAEHILERAEFLK